jgi:hypothetical protein
MSPTRSKRRCFDFGTGGVDFNVITTAEERSASFFTTIRGERGVKYTYVAAIALLGAAFAPAPVSGAMYNLDANARVVYLRTSCTEGSSPVVTLANCFDTTTDLRSWIETVRRPTALNPLAVEIGPGQFRAFDLTCTAYPGFITLRGSGTDQTVIEFEHTKAWTITGCAGMVFSDFVVRKQSNKQPSYTNYIAWWQGGASTWRNVDVVGLAYAWREYNCSSPGTHYWFSSRLTVRQTSSDGAFPASVYVANCDSSWIFGSEMTLDVATSAASPGGSVLTVGADGSVGEIRVYGSVIRALGGGGSANQSLGAAVASEVGEIHIHGTGIDLLATGDASLGGLSASGSGSIHADGASFNMSTGPGGSITRISDQTTSGHGIHAPCLWHGHSAPPSILSVDGADVAVVTGGSRRPAFRDLQQRLQQQVV